MAAICSRGAARRNPRARTSFSSCPRLWPKSGRSWTRRRSSTSGKPTSTGWERRMSCRKSTSYWPRRRSQQLAIRYTSRKDSKSSLSKKAMLKLNRSIRWWCTTGKTWVLLRKRSITNKRKSSNPDRKSPAMSESKRLKSTTLKFKNLQTSWKSKSKESSKSSDYIT